MNSPFNNLIDMFREEGKFYNEPSFYFAKVTSELTNLKVMINDKTKYYTYTTPRMYIPEYVYKPYVKTKNK